MLIILSHEGLYGGLHGRWTLDKDGTPGYSPPNAQAVFGKIFATIAADAAAAAATFDARL